MAELATVGSTPRATRKLTAARPHASFVAYCPPTVEPEPPVSPVEPPPDAPDMSDEPMPPVVATVPEGVRAVGPTPVEDAFFFRR